MNRSSPSGDESGRRVLTEVAGRELRRSVPSDDLKTSSVQLRVEPLKAIVAVRRPRRRRSHRPIGRERRTSLPSASMTSDVGSCAARSLAKTILVPSAHQVGSMSSPGASVRRCQVGAILLDRVDLVAGVRADPGRDRKAVRSHPGTWLRRTAAARCSASDDRCTTTAPQVVLGLPLSLPHAPSVQRGVRARARAHSAARPRSAGRACSAAPGAPCDRGGDPGRASLVHAVIGERPASARRARRSTASAAAPCARRAPSAAPSRSIASRRARLHEAHEVRQHHRVGLGVRRARTSARSSGRRRGAPRSRRRRWRSRPAARRAPAPGGRAPRRASPSAISSAARSAAMLGDRVGQRRVERLDRVRERVHRARGELRHRLRGHQAGVGDHERRAHEPRTRRRRPACGGSGVISAPESVVGIAAHAQAVGARDRLGRVDHAAPAERHQRPAVDRARARRPRPRAPGPAARRARPQRPRPPPARTAAARSVVSSA